MKEYTDEELSKKLNAHSGTTTQDSIQFQITNRLKDSVEDFSKKSSRQTRWLIILTIILGIIALLQLMLLFTQP